MATATSAPPPPPQRNGFVFFQNFLFDGSPIYRPVVLKVEEVRIRQRGDDVVLRESDDYMNFELGLGPKVVEHLGGEGATHRVNDG